MCPLWISLHVIPLLKESHGCHVWIIPRLSLASIPLIPAVLAEENQFLCGYAPRADSQTCFSDYSFPIAPWYFRIACARSIYSAIRRPGTRSRGKREVYLLSPRRFEVESVLQWQHSRVQNVGSKEELAEEGILVGPDPPRQTLFRGVSPCSVFSLLKGSTSC